MDEGVVIEEIKKGDNNQLAMIYREYRSEFIAWITSNYSCSRDDAKDVYQVSILALHENILNNKLQKLRSSIKTYLFAIGKNKFLEFRKTESRITRDVDPAVIDLEEVSSWEYEEKELKLQVTESSLGQLGDPCKSLLELYYFHGLSMDEISERLNYKNRDTTKNLKFKCLTRLRKIFVQEMDKVNLDKNGY